MSWELKTDYCGMTGSGISLECKDASQNKSGQYLEKHGRTGGYAATKPFGVRAAPANAYTIKGALTISGKALGTVNSVGGLSYALESISWSTGADAEPTLNAAAKQVKTGASTRNTFPVPQFAISPGHVAQIPSFVWSSSAVAAFAMPTADGANADCELLECRGEISCSVKTNDLNGAPRAHDVTNGHIVINITIAQYGTTEPTVNAGSGWDVSSPLTCEDPDSDMPTWTMALSHPLAKMIPSRSVSAAMSAPPGDGEGGGDGEGEGDGEGDGEQR